MQRCPYNELSLCEDECWAGGTLDAFLTQHWVERAPFAHLVRERMSPRAGMVAYRSVLLVPAIKPRVQFRLYRSPVTKQTELPRLLGVLCCVTLNSFDPTDFFVDWDGSVLRLATGWTGRGSNPGGGEIFRSHPDRSWGPPSLLYRGYWVSIPGLKRPGWC